MKKSLTVLIAGSLLTVWAASSSYAVTKSPNPSLPIADKTNAGTNPQRRVITCNTAASPAWCWGHFIAHCGHSKGVISSNPDGSISCTIS